MEALIRKGEVTLSMDIPSGFSSKLKKGQTGTLQILVDGGVIATIAFLLPMILTADAGPGGSRWCDDSFEFDEVSEENEMR